MSDFTRLNQVYAKWVWFSSVWATKMIFFAPWFHFRFSNDDKKNTFDNGANNGHGLKNVTCKQTFSINSCTIYDCALSDHKREIELSEETAFACPLFVLLVWYIVYDYLMDLQIHSYLLIMRLRQWKIESDETFSWEFDYFCHEVRLFALTHGKYFLLFISVFLNECCSQKLKSVYEIQQNEICFSFCCLLHVVRHVDFLCNDSVVDSV